MDKNFSWLTIRTMDSTGIWYSHKNFFIEIYEIKEHLLNGNICLLTEKSRINTLFSGIVDNTNETLVEFGFIIDWKCKNNHDSQSTFSGRINAFNADVLHLKWLTHCHTKQLSSELVITGNSKLHKELWVNAAAALYEKEIGYFSSLSPHLI